METTAENSAKSNERPPDTKFCKHCAAVIPKDAVICTVCGRQVEELVQAQQSPPIIINNTNTNTNLNTVSTQMTGRQRSKWVALALCFFLGAIGAHKFYEGKIGMGILYIFTVGLFMIGTIIDFIVLLFKPNPYYV